jgi:hydrogenase maturation protease
VRVHPGVAAVPSPARTRCRALVGGFGIPAMRDLDFGRQFVSYAGALEWPADVVVEDLSVAPHLALHRLQELSPEKVVFVGSVERGTGGPGAIRRYALDRAQPDPGDVHLSLTEGLAGVTELQHTLRVLRHWGMLPNETVIVEVEPADTSFGLGFSEEVGSSIEPIVEVVRTELGCLLEQPEGDEPRVADGEQATPRLVAVGKDARDGDRRPEREPEPGGRRTGVVDLADYADLHNRVSDAVANVRRFMLPDPPEVAGLSLAARSRPLGTGLHTKGDWYDFLPVADGWLGIAMGDVVERGLEAAIVMSHLRSEVRAAAAACGTTPGDVLARVDQVVSDTGFGTGSTLLYLVVNAASGEVRFANAGHCRPLLVLDEGSAFFVERAWSSRLGAVSGRRGARPEATLELPRAGSLLLYTDGLLLDELHRDDARQGLSSAAAGGTRDVGRLCDHVMTRCLGGRRRRDDASLLALRLGETVQP